MCVTIEKLSVENIEELIEIARDSWKWTYADIYSIEFINNWIDENYSRERLLNEITRAQSDRDIIFLGSFVKSKLVGFIELKTEADRAELLRLYLKPEYTHRGIGKLLLLEAEVIMKKKGIVQCRLLVHQKNNIGKSFYEKNGFEVKDIDADHIVMEKKLQSIKNI
ncbi:MAG: GNAT family N-acetyltransferase [Thermoplasmataceae archaeon]|jgi:ribosomal protein S18 acetylase RimI-like enzyme